MSVDQPVAQVIVRLSDVGPDGEATRVSYGVLNLNHHSGADAPSALVTDERRTVDVQLNGMAQSFPRSEEHTSELQSRFDLVCRLLLEKINRIFTYRQY